MTPLIRAGAALSRPHERNFVLWTPAAITTQLWFDAADADTITIDTGVSEWNDKSGNGRHLAQGTAGSQPARISAEQNGLAVLRFDGSNDFLVGNTALTGLAQNVGTVLMAAVRRWPSPPATTTQLFVISGGTGVGRCRLDGGRSANLSGAGGRRLDADSFSGVLGSAVPNAWQLHVAAFQYSNASLFNYINGTLDGSALGGFLTAGNTSNTAPQTISVGGSPVGAELFAGDIGELICTHDITQATRQLIEGYLAWRWGLVSGLPSGHPYKSAAPLL